MEQELTDVDRPQESHGIRNEQIPDTLSNKDNVQEWENGSTVAKQHCKMPNSVDISNGMEPDSEQRLARTRTDSHERKLTYTWKQTLNEIVISMEITNLPDVLNALDISFTSMEATISISGAEKHVITFHDSIQKEKSLVQILKGNVAIRVVKQKPGLWPALEESPSKNLLNHKGDTFLNKSKADGGMAHMNSMQDDVVLSDGDKNLKSTEKLMVEKLLDKGVSNSKIEIEKIEQRQPEFMDKDEEPVYHLDHLKHDFFQRGSSLTLQVFTKSVNKDAVKIVFSAQGFVLKFCTSDQKLLQLHEGTTSDTTFSWTVKTRKEILPDECKIKVKPSVIEILLHTATVERWASLEAPCKKASEPSKSDTWMPLNGPVPQPQLFTPSSSTTSSKGDTSSQDGMKRDNKKLLFDEMADINVQNRAKEKQINIALDSADSNPSLLSNVKSKPHTTQDWNKPTAKVQPLNKIKDNSAAVVSPGYAGLVNFGNTCFMNCIIQVLSNTREFRDYFLDGRFEDEINEGNPLGMKGHLAATFGVLLRWLWSCKKHCWEPRKLKDLISKKNPQFFGFAQHDAHEFLAFLLDGLHEDLNRIKQKPYTQTIDSNGRADEVVAAEAWDLYKQRNDSVVVDLFQGQYKSKLVCPKCGKVSITFDPFLYLSVPLPKKKKLIHVTFIWKEFYKKPVKYHLQVCYDSNVDRLVDELSQRTGVSPKDITVFEAYKGRIHKFFLNGASLAYVDDKTSIIACELLSEELAGEEVIQIPVVQRTLSPPDFPTQCANCDKYCNEGITLKRCTNCYKVGYCNRSCQQKHWPSHKSQCNNAQQAIGCPFVISLPASRLTFANLSKQMEGFARFSVNLFQPPVKSTTENNAKPSPSSVATPAAPPPPPMSNLSSTLSQSSSSLNSLDSLSSASSTCTLTGDQSDTQIPEENPEAAVTEGDSGTSTLSLNDTASSGDSFTGLKGSNSDSGLESSCGKSEKGVPTSQVMGVPAKDAEREKAWPTFLIQAASSEGMSIKGAEWIEDKGDTPLGLTSGRFLAMIWRNDEKSPSYVMVQSKELEAEEVDDLNNINNMSNMPTLYHCLELFTEPEILNPEEAWYCPSCKKHVEASKQMSIWKLPHTLVIQLKRFSFQSFLRRSKIEKRVEFPIRGLDLRRYCVGLSSNEPAPVYDLYGVVNHHGHLIDGHYTSYVRCTSDGPTGPDHVGWRLCDDSRVSSVDNEKFVVNKDAYLLFYRRRGMPAIINCPISGSANNQPITAVDPRTAGASPSIISNKNSQPGMVKDIGDPQNSTHSQSESNIQHTNSNNAQRSDSNSLTSSNQRRQDVHHENEGVSAMEQPTLDTNLVGTASSELRVEEEEAEEKGDQEKEFYDCDNNLRDASQSDDDDDEPRLVIETESDLGYTDMEAVD